MFKLGFVLGRFQMLHQDHENMIRKALSVCDRVLLMVGSSTESGTVRNPFNLYTRMDLIRRVFNKEISNGKLLISHTDDMTHEEDHSYEWGDFLLEKIEMWKSHYAIIDNVDCFIYGNDEERGSWFDPEKIKGVSHLVIARNDRSATRIRQLMSQNKYDAWSIHMPKPISSRATFCDLRRELLDVEWYKRVHSGEHQQVSSDDISCNLNSLLGEVNSNV